MLKRNFLLTAVAIVLSASATRAAAAPCVQRSVPVSLSDTDPTTYHVVGWLCGEDPAQHQTVQVTLSGSTYGHVYWDLPFPSDRYSYVQFMVDADYAVFNLDRIGIGLSDHPLPELVDIQSNARVAHQVIQALRAGTVSGVAYQRVILVGHSLGSMIAIEEASQFADVDGVVVSSFIHFSSPSVATLIAENTYPAALDPRFPGYLPGYITTKPETRGSLFYYAPKANPTVIAIDEATKETVTDGELVTGSQESSSPASLNIHVPVLLALGQFDRINCTDLTCDTSTIAALEASHFSPQACLQTNVIPNSGHSINLHLNAEDWFAIARSWADGKVGVASNLPAPNPCP